MSVIDFLATFGSDESMAKVFYFYLKNKEILRQLSSNEKDEKVIKFFKENNNFLEKEVRKSFIQGDGLVMFERIKSFIKNNE